MKKLKFKTSKGEFVLMDGAEQIDQTLRALLDEYSPVSKVSEMTEEQLAEVVDSRIKGGGLVSCPREKCFKDYMNGGYPRRVTALYSLKTLVKSLGWNLLENPEGNKPHSICNCSTCVDEWYYYNKKWQEAESKTLYSPILLKKI